MDPFATSCDRNIVQRHSRTIEFIGTRQLGRVLDLGERNPLTARIEDRYGILIENTSGDLDDLALTGTFDTVLCFEVIEHLMNPLRILQQVHRVLEPSGSFFLSTPKHKPHFLWDKHHFTEFDWKRLSALIARAGFQVMRKDEFRTMPMWWYFTGIRPLIRMFNNKVFVLELRK
jgi:SAM-dependent methyltransferase